jgi:DNA-binding SARP family transcriptional activator
MTSNVQFRILGPQEVSAAGQLLALGGRKQRTVLAVLLLNANEPVTRERLIDAVWGEEPPAEAGASLRVYVARLRKLLATNADESPSLETTAHGYVLRIHRDEYDFERFRRLVGKGEYAHALDLWRGPALADLTDQEWARSESERLEELRLSALEERIDADLEEGRHSMLVPELERLVAENPYRERFVRQLVTSLYRCGRQPDALRAYADARDELRDDFGLEPSRELRELERRILVQDPALDLPRSPPQALRRRARSRVRGSSLLALAVVVAIALAGALALARDAPAPRGHAAALRGNSVVAIEAATGNVLGEVALGGRPAGLALGEGSVWVGNRDDETLLRLDPRSRKIIETIGLNVEPTDIAVGGGSVWVASSDDLVLRVDPVINDVIATFRLPGNEVGFLPQIEYARGAAWVSYGGLLARIDPGTRWAVLTGFRNVRRIASSRTALWGVVGMEFDQIRRLDPLGDPIRLGPLGSIHGLGGLLADDRELWTGTGEGTLWRLAADTGRVTASLPLHRRIAGVAKSGRGIWIVTLDGGVLRADSASGRVVNELSLGLFPPPSRVVQVADGVVWVAVLAH